MKRCVWLVVGLVVGEEGGQIQGRACRVECFPSPPYTYTQLNAFCLNFHGRVTQASVKNFQLVTDDLADRVYLQFGKVCVLGGGCAVPQLQGGPLNPL